MPTKVEEGRSERERDAVRHTIQTSGDIKFRGPDSRG